jgi:hypothetical protein
VFHLSHSYITSRRPFYCCKDLLPEEQRLLGSLVSSPCKGPSAVRHHHKIKKYLMIQQFWSFPSYSSRSPFDFSCVLHHFPIPFFPSKKSLLNTPIATNLRVEVRLNRSKVIINLRLSSLSLSLSIRRRNRNKSISERVRILLKRHKIPMNSGLQTGSSQVRFLGINCGERSLDISRQAGNGVEDGSRVC